MKLEDKIGLFLSEATKTGEPLYTDKDEAIAVAKELERGIDAPFVKGTVSTLGGNPSVLIKLSLDPKNEWNNNIFENSRYIHLRLEPDSTKNNLEMFNKSHKIEDKPMRKQKAKSVKEAISKINKYIDKVK